MATAKKLPSGSWRVQVYSHTDYDGKRHYESFTAPTKREAELMAAEFMARKDRESRSDYTVKEAIQKYINLKEKVLSPATIKGYTAILIKYAPIESIRISRLDNQTVQEFISSLAATSSPKYVKNIYALFYSAVKMFQPDIKFNVTLPQKANRIHNAPSKDDIQLLYENSKGELKKAIYLGILGVRRGEICALEYSDIKPGNLLHIHRDMVKGKDGWKIKEIPKTSESERYVLLPPDYKEVLSPGEGRIMSYYPNSITDAFHDLAAKYEININFHELRHFFASTAHAMGIPDQYIMAMGGWKSDNVMKRIYRNSINDIEKEYRTKFAEWVNRIT